MRWCVYLALLMGCASVGATIDDRPDLDNDGIPDVEDDDADGDGIPDDEDDFVDLDDDGFDRREDCDDTDPAVNPGVEEICGNGKDDNCDGSADPCRFEGVLELEDADLAVTGDERRDVFGSSLVFLGDVDRDGYSDLLVGAESVGLAWRFGGGGNGALSAVDANTFYRGSSPTFGQVVSGGGDLTGDGLVDVVFVEPFYSSQQRRGLGRAEVRSALGAIDRTGATVVGRANEDFLGQATHVLEDVDDNGLADLWVTVAGEPTLVAVGPGVARAEAVLQFTKDPSVPLSLPSAGDFDGDGRADILMQQGTTEGVVFLAPEPGVYDVADADVAEIGGPIEQRGGQRTGGLTVADLDGDGYDDAVLAYGFFRFTEGPDGDVRISRGGAEGPQPGFTGQIEGAPRDDPEPTGAFGGLLSSADFDRDGREDLVVGLYTNVGIFYDAPVDSRITSEDWDVLIPSTEELAPRTLDVSQDVNRADGSTSLAVGYGFDRGQVYLFRISGL